MTSTKFWEKICCFPGYVNKAKHQWRHRFSENISGMLSQNLFFTKMAEVSMLPLLLYSLIAIVFIIIFYLLIKNFLTRRKLVEAKRDASKEIPSPAEHLGRRRTRVHLRGSQLNSCVLSTDKIIPRSVNYHFTRQCNYKCGFCFHTAKNSFVLPIEDAKRGLKMLKEAGRVFHGVVGSID